MDLVRTSSEAILTLPATVKADTVTVQCSEEVIISGILQDQGDGWRPLHPLEVSVAGAAEDIPFSLQPGTYAIRLTRDTLECRAVLLVGANLQALSMVDVAQSDVNAGGVSAVAAASEALPAGVLTNVDATPIPIVFTVPSPYTSAGDYTANAWGYTATGDLVFVKVYSRTADGMTVEPVAPAAELHWETKRTTQ